MRESTTLSIYALTIASFFAGATEKRFDVTHVAQVMTAMKRLGLVPASLRPEWKTIMTRVFKEFSDQPIESWFKEDGWDANPADFNTVAEWRTAIVSKLARQNDGKMTPAAVLASIAPITLLEIWLNDYTFNSVPETLRATFPDPEPINLFGS